MIFNWHARGQKTNLRGVWFGSQKLFDEIREKEKQREDNGGWEKIKVKEDKGERNVWLRKKKKEVNKSIRWFKWDTCPLGKEIYKIKITIVLAHSKLSQNFHNS